MDLTTDNQEEEEDQETFQAEVQLQQEHSQTFIPILERTVFLSPDPAPP